MLEELDPFYSDRIAIVVSEVDTLRVVQKMRVVMKLSEMTLVWGNGEMQQLCLQLLNGDLTTTKLDYIKSVCDYE
ncbi:MAG: hypothetical protein N3A69_07625 [Leptospiraceae bacterium]|nr:hypothetical protein [Leptospiraceae bacterium]